ncbi:MAG TPA: HAD-IIIC family phosphatase [Bryobacteraceae bacterium]
MILRQSRFIHQVPVSPGQILVLHAVNYVRLNVTQEVRDIIAFFAEPRSVPDAYRELEKFLPYDRDTLSRCVESLLKRGILTERNPEEEIATFAKELGQTYGRDPIALLERYRREMKEGSEPCWAAVAPQGLPDIGVAARRLDIILFGECDIQMESDFLRREAARRGLNLVVSSTFPDDLGFASEHRHDAIMIGALRARFEIVGDTPAGSHPQKPYVDQVCRILRELRERTSAPILVNNLPEPTVQPLGLAERGLRGHRMRFRLTNIALAEVVEGFPDVHLIDVAAALGAIGSEHLLDDGQMDFTHFGSPGWLLQRPQSEMSAVHHAFPAMEPLVQWVHGDPYIRENAMARIHIDALVAALGIGRKKCVIVDLDGTLWPGVLAETGSPFAWNPATSGSFSFVGTYFGIHEALRCLKRRGIVLACVSKNDEATIRELWKYGDHYPRERLLTLDDFVTWRINWKDKAENILSIAAELCFAPDTFLFIDDHPVERDRVRQALPGVEVWGENLFGLRRALLTDPRLQPPRITEESAMRTPLVKAQLSREKLLQAEMDHEAYIRSLEVNCRMERITGDDQLGRIEELFQRTTQFNTTGRKFSVAELRAMLSNHSADLFSLRVSDRFGDYGLVGAAVCKEGEILGFVLSCRVLGLGVEHEFLKYIIHAVRTRSNAVTARIVETSRNIRVRNIYRDSGFRETEPGMWRLETASAADCDAQSLCQIEVQLTDPI